MISLYVGLFSLVFIIGLLHVCIWNQSINNNNKKIHLHQSPNEEIKKNSLKAKIQQICTGKTLCIGRHIFLERQESLQKRYADTFA